MDYINNNYKIDLKNQLNKEIVHHMYRIFNFIKRIFYTYDELEYRN